jgi:predicted component of type VI protein secretion system
MERREGEGTRESGLQLFSGLELRELPLSPRPAPVHMDSPCFIFLHSSSRLFQHLVTLMFLFAMWRG